MLDVPTFDDFSNTEINEHLDKAYAEEPIVASMEQELKDVYAPFDYKETLPATSAKTEKGQ